MNIMSLDAAYGTGTIDDMQTAPDASDLNAMNGKEPDPNHSKKKIQPMQLLSDADLNMQPRYSKSTPPSQINNPQHPSANFAPPAHSGAPGSNPSGYSKLPPLPQPQNHGYPSAMGTVPQQRQQQSRPPMLASNGVVSAPHYQSAGISGSQGARNNPQSEFGRETGAPPFEHIEQPYANVNFSAQQQTRARATDELGQPVQSVAPAVYSQPENYAYSAQQPPFTNAKAYGSTIQPGRVNQTDRPEVNASAFARSDPRRLQSERFSRYDNSSHDTVEVVADTTNEKGNSFFQRNRKIIVLVIVVVVALLIGVIIAVVVHKMKQKGGTESTGSGVLKHNDNASQVEMQYSGDANSVNLRAGGGVKSSQQSRPSRSVPHYVGEYVGQDTWEPSCAWDQSASAFVKVK